MMSNETLTHMRGQYLTKAKAQAEEPTEKPADDAGGKDKAENMKHNGLTKRSSAQEEHHTSVPRCEQGDQFLRRGDREQTTRRRRLPETMLSLS
jgi:hypothetical protein